MSDDEDLELQALQRKLDDAFETTRPRAGFEDALWSRMQARRPLWRRAQDFFSGLIESVREVPAMPAAAVAVVLVVAIGVGILSLSGTHFGGGAGSTSAGLSAQDHSGGTQYNAAPGGFGRLPAPALLPSSEAPKAVNPVVPAAGQPAADLYFGPATLVWAGTFNFQVTSAPVYRYAEPSAADANQFAVALGASRQVGQQGGILGGYGGNGFVLTVTGSIPVLTREPFYSITPDRSTLPPPGPTPTATADAFLSAHSLLPAWPYVTVVVQAGDVQRVLYLRQFAVAGAGQVFMVDGFGERHGLEVDIRGGQPLQAMGPLPVSLVSADYRVISTDQAVRSALSSAPVAGATIEPTPTIQLTKVELVYALAIAGDHSFYEPAFLFSGTFVHNGVTYTKRVLVPAVSS